MKTFLWAGCLILLCIGLNACKNLAKLAYDGAACPTFVNGVFIAPFSLSSTKEQGKRPLMVTKRYGNDYIEFGKIVSRNEDGVVFDPDAQGFGNPDARLYKFSEIVCLVNEKNEIIYGAKPSTRSFPTWSLEVTVVPESNPKEDVVLTAEDKKPFSYCLAPGKYSIRKIEFILGDDRVDKSKDIPPMTFIVTEGKRNYLGEIVMDSMTDTTNYFTVPFSTSHPLSSSIGGQVGLAGALLFSAGGSGDGVAHRLAFRYERQPAASLRSEVR